IHPSQSQAIVQVVHPRRTTAAPGRRNRARASLHTREIDTMANPIPIRDPLRNGASVTANALTSAEPRGNGSIQGRSKAALGLDQKIQELQNNAGRPAAATPDEEDVLALSDTLERERRQLAEDEEALMRQMRDMEMAMSRERAELARQRNELQRLNEEIRHEL